MESIAYLHLASAYEASESIEVVPIRVDVKLFSWKKLSSVAAMRLLSVALTMAVLSVAGQALALQSRPGSSGANVTTVQRCLKQLGYYNGPVTGNFGSLTRNAVIKFQQRKRTTCGWVCWSSNSTTAAISVSDEKPWWRQWRFAIG